MSASWQKFCRVPGKFRRIQMTKMLKLACLLFLALTVVGCGKRAIVPENTIAAAYIDIEKAYENGKDIASTLIGALFADERSQAVSEYVEVFKKIDTLKDPLKMEWAIVALGGDPKSLTDAHEMRKKIAVAIKIKADEDKFQDLLKDVFRDDEGRFRVGLIDGKYLILGWSESAFVDMYGLYLGQGRRSDDFDDLSKISGDTICRVSTAPVSSLLKRFELTQEIERFGRFCEEEDIAEMILNMGAISLEVGIGDEVGLSLSVECDSSGEAKIIEKLMDSVAFLVRVGGDVGAFRANNAEFLDAWKLSSRDKAAIAMRKALFIGLAKKVRVDRDGDVAMLSIAIDVDLIEKAASKKDSGGKTGLFSSLSSSVSKLFNSLSNLEIFSSFFEYRKEAQKAACISNMKQLQTAAELYMTQKDSIPTIRDLCGPDNYLRIEPTCPKDGSHYLISRGDGGFEIKCGSGDPEHVLNY